MAIGSPYVSVEQLKGYLHIELANTFDDTNLGDAVASASSEVEKHCHRQFNKADTATTRKYKAGSGVVWVDDFYTESGLVVTVNGSSVTDYELHPVNGVVDGEEGWPFYRIYGDFERGDKTEVTASWGWESVPAPVYQACLILASENFKMKDAPFGVAGFGDFGPVRVRDNPIASMKLKKYARQAVLVR